VARLTEARFVSQFKNNYFAAMCSSSEEGSYLSLRLIYLVARLTEARCVSPFTDFYLKVKARFWP